VVKFKLKIMQLYLFLPSVRQYCRDVTGQLVSQHGYLTGFDLSNKAHNLSGKKYDR